MRLTLEQAVANARNAGYARRFPENDDPRLRHGAIFSEVFPRFLLSAEDSIFTLGSCFVRSLEEKMPGFLLPARNFAVPGSERPGRPNGILNEYNPGTMCQRIEYAVRGASFGENCIAGIAGGYIDLLLPEYVTPATRERIMERRAEVDQVYKSLSESKCVIVTLDQVEAWYDRTAGLYLNRIPPLEHLLAHRERFELHILEIDETRCLLERMVDALKSVGITKILFTVSPVPLESTFSGRDCATANIYSKSVLVVAADSVSRIYPEVDYFPGYEIVMSAGPDYHDSDFVHVRDDLVEFVTNYLIDRYVR